MTRNDPKFGSILWGCETHNHHNLSPQMWGGSIGCETQTPPTSTSCHPKVIPNWGPESIPHLRLFYDPKFGSILWGCETPNHPQPVTPNVGWFYRGCKNWTPHIHIVSPQSDPKLGTRIHPKFEAVLRPKTTPNSEGFYGAVRPTTTPNHRQPVTPNVGWFYRV